MKEERIDTTESNGVENVETENSQSNVTEVVIVRDTDSVSDATTTASNTSIDENDAADAKPSRKKRVTKMLLTALLVVIIAAIIVYTAVQDFSGENVSLSRVIEMIGANWYYLLVLLGLFATTILAESLKFFIMIRKTTKKYMFGTSFTCAALGKFYDYITPFGSGGQPFQIYHLSKNGVPSGPAGAIPIGSMFLNQFTFFVCSIVSFIVGIGTDIMPKYMQILAYFGSFCYIIVSLWLVVFSFMPKVGHKVVGWGTKVCAKIRICKNPEKWIEKGNRAIDNNKTNMGIIFQSKRVLIVGTILSFVFNIAQCSMPYFALILFSDAIKGAGLAPSWDLWFEVTRITFFIYCAITIVPTPGNSGAADGTFYGLFRSVLITVAGASFTCMMVWRVFSFYMYLIVGITVTICIKVADRVRAKRNSVGELL